MINSIIGQRFEVRKKLHRNSGYKVYKGVDSKNNSKIVIKIDCGTSGFSYVQHEIKILIALASTPGIHRVIDKGVHLGKNYLITQYLGKHLTKKAKFWNYKLSLGCVLKIAEEIFLKIEFLHRAGYIHRFIKPEKILTGYHSLSQSLHLIGYRYAVKANKKEKLGQYFLSPKYHTYSPVSSFKKIPYQPQFDIESAMYILIHFYSGSLPWLKTNCTSDAQMNEIKENISLGKLCRDCPIEFLNTLRYVRSLRHGQELNYEIIRNSLKCLVLRTKTSLHYDWNIIESKPILPKLYQKSRSLSQDIKNFENKSEKSIDIEVFKFKKHSLSKKVPLITITKTPFVGKAEDALEPCSGFFVSDYEDEQSSGIMYSPDIVSPQGSIHLNTSKSYLIQRDIIIEENQGVYESRGETCDCSYKEHLVSCTKNCLTSKTRKSIKLPDRNRIKMIKKENLDTLV